MRKESLKILAVKFCVHSKDTCFQDIQWMRNPFEFFYTFWENFFDISGQIIMLSY